MNNLEKSRSIVQGKIRSRRSDKSFPLTYMELYHQQYHGAVAYPLSKIYHYPLNKRELDKKAKEILGDFKADLNRPILIVKGFPVAAFDAEYKIFLNTRRKYVDIVIDGHGRVVIFTTLQMTHILAHVRDDIKTMEELNQLFTDINESYAKERKAPKHIHAVKSLDPKTIDGQVKIIASKFGFAISGKGSGTTKWNEIACPVRLKTIYKRVEGEKILYWTLYLLFHAFDGDPYSLKEEMIMRFEKETAAIWKHLKGKDFLMERYQNAYAETLSSFRTAEDWYYFISYREMEARIKEEMKEVHTIVLRKFQQED